MEEGYIIRDQSLRITAGSGNFSRAVFKRNTSESWILFKKNRSNLFQTN